MIFGIADWQILALLTSFATAAYIHANNMFQVEGITLVFLRGLVFTAVCWPVMFMFPLPQTLNFYLFSLAVGGCVALGDKALFSAAAKHGGRLTSLFISLKIFFVFSVWSFIAPEGFLELWHQPLIFTGIVVCYAAMVAAMMGLRKQDASLAALIAIIPAAVFLGLADVLTKLSLEGVSLAQFTQFFWLGQVAAMVVAGIMKSYGKLTTEKAPIFTRHNFIGTFGVILPFLFLITFFLTAVAKAPNPAYVGGITVLTTVWLTLYYHWKKVDNSSLTPTFIIVTAAMGLVYLTS